MKTKYDVLYTHRPGLLETEVLRYSSDADDPLVYGMRHLSDGWCSYCNRFEYAGIRDYVEMSPRS